MSARNRRTRGFTLVELMIAVAIVGLLSSVAIPEFQHATLRARASERTTVLSALYGAVQDITQQLQCVPDNSGGGTAACLPRTPGTPAPASFASAWNPPGMPGSTKRPFSWTAQGWKDLPMIVEGGSYYSYSFTASDPDDGSAPTLAILAVGDLDGDGQRYQKQMNYVATGFSFVYVSETPPRGMGENVF
jgi:prepilin-type N-terminal cleavage/methylation domain-containing protein